ncbi:unnamed protein product [Brassica rapa]|uniref:Thymidylate kinase n=1 Tax=Brassica campestris TaxID=3711 RepID=A0A8D9I449_BRACM|nr:unnamed protein product [Brassica rapa]
MGSPKKNENKGFFAAMTSGFSMFGSAMSRSVNGLLAYEGVEVINPDGGKEDAEEEAQRGRWKDEERDSYWKMMQKYIGSDITSMVTLPVIIFEPMTMLQKMAEVIMCTSIDLSSGRYEVDGYVYSADEEPKIMMTGKWNEKISYQPCDAEGEPLPGTELKEVSFTIDKSLGLEEYHQDPVRSVEPTTSNPSFLLSYRLTEPFNAVNSTVVIYLSFPTSLISTVLVIYQLEKSFFSLYGSLFFFYRIFVGWCGKSFHITLCYAFREMVSHKCVEEFSLQFPANARAPRSARKKRSFKKEEITENDKTCAIDLLATVAENLLSETGSSHMSIDKPVEDHCLVKEEFPVEDKPLKPATLPEFNPYQGSSMSPCGFSSVISGKVEIEAEGFSHSGGIDSCQAGQDLKPSVDGGAVVLDARPNGVGSLGGSSSRTKVPSMGAGVSLGALDDVHMFSRDDDENFSGYICPRVTKKSPRSVPRVGDRRIRKILASRHWKGGSRHSEAKSWRNYYLHHQRSYPIKKRKYFDHISDSVSDDYRLRSKMQRGSRAVSTMKGPGASFVSSDSHVRLRIKSFRVPELFVEIPETATVGSLKRMVMEAVSTLLSDGHRIGLMVQGKKVRDDNKTLHQTGISQDNTHLDSLDFSLEPSSEAPHLLSSNPSGHVCEELSMCRTSDMDTLFKTEPDLALFPSGSFDKETAADDSKALVHAALTELSPPQPPRHKSNKQQQQTAQRRMRRPFSVTEVEALVQAVEKLGTGRWRDVKHSAFEDADHRTYVDLKDKWKTLVHTAKISPQQRRGEPVPQELLNRVLNAHGYWSQQHMETLALPKPDFRALALPPRSFNYLSRSSVRMENLTFSSEAGAKPRGALIVVEGLDRSGKSTQCAKLRSFLESSGHPTELWRFPDRETSVGQMISAYLSNKSQLDDRTIHLLFSANRWEKRSLMEEKLKGGTTLIVDRYSYSGVAFSSAKGLGIEWCKAPEVGLLAPDSVLYLDISPERAAERGGYGDERYERVDFQKKVSEFYQTLRDSSWKIIDAGDSMEEVEKKIQQVVLDKVKECALGKSLSLLWSS